MIRGPTARRLVVFSLALAALPLVIAGWIALPLPPDLASPGAVPSLVIEDRHGLVLRTTRAEDGSRGGWVPLAVVAPTVLQAFLAAEDHRYFEHRGVDLRAVARAARDNLRARRIVSGASTITMQTARILRPTPRNWTGKLTQLLWALRLEAHLDKTTILEQYLYRVPLGQGAVGVAAGAALYLGADPRELGLGQAALLAALAHAPSRDNPLVDPARARAQRRRVLGRMAALGYAGPDELARAAEEPVLRRGATNTFLAPHFTTHLIQEGGAPTGTLRTTLDLDLQRALEAEVRHAVGVLADRNVRHGAVVVLDNPTGEVLAWVGSPEFWAEGDGQVDMVVSARQPGSVLKPFLYGLAFDRGSTAATVLPDIPRTYATSTGPYQPRNYDRRFRGPVRARIALASSLNVPSVELADRLGAGALLNTLHAAGFSSLTRSAEHYGLGLALGNGEVTLLEVANGFRGIANGGHWTPVRWVEEPDGRAGGNRGGGPPAGARPGAPDTDAHRFLSAGSAALLLDILSDPSARTPGFGTDTPFDFPFPAAAKTGTSRHFTDNWAVVATGNFTVAVWVGNFSGRPMQGVSGISGAGPLIYRATLETARRYPPGHLPTPEQAGAIAAPICILSGMLATPECPSTIEWFLPGTEPTRRDDWQHGGRITLPPEYAEWAATGATDSGWKQVMVETSVRLAEHTGDIPMTGDIGDTAAGITEGDSARSHRILSPLDGDIYEIPVGIDPRYATIPLIAAGSGEGVRWSVDGREVRTARWRLEHGEHLVRAEWGPGIVDSVRITVR
jgi:penicillin-binding protein 1C